MKKIVSMCVLFALMSLFVVACGSSSGNGVIGGGGSITATAGVTATTGVTATIGVTATAGATATTGSGASNTVGLAATTFAESSITIKKGESITLTNKTATVHIIANGSWDGTTAAPKAEADAPVASNLTFNTDNQSQTIGPFNTAGTFHYFCSVHQGMNLTVTVQ